MRSDNYTPNDIIYGTVYIGNENADEIINFTKADLTYICKQAVNPNKSETTERNIAYIIIYMENTTDQSARKRQRSKRRSRSSESTTETTTTLTKRRRCASTVRRHSRASAP